MCGLLHSPLPEYITVHGFDKSNITEIVKYYQTNEYVQIPSVNKTN